MEIELIILIIIQLLGTSLFVQFEIETPAIKRIMKWLILDGLTLLLFRFIGHWCLLFPAIMLTIGTSFHFYWCKKNGIDPFKATPRKRYYELRGWKWEE